MSKKNKYSVSSYADVVLWKNNANLGDNSSIEENNKQIPDMINKLSEGWEICSAVPVNTADTAVIKYIIRKKNE